MSKQIDVTILGNLIGIYPCLQYSFKLNYIQNYQFISDIYFYQEDDGDDADGGKDIFSYSSNCTKIAYLNTINKGLIVIYMVISIVYEMD